MNYAINALPNIIPIGNQMESGARIIEFDISEWQAEYPDIAASISMQYPAGGTPFLAAGITQSDGRLSWAVMNDATQKSGKGTIVIRGLSGDVEKRSVKTRVQVLSGHPAAGEAPADAQDWLSEAAVLKTDLEGLLATLESELAGI